MATALRTASSVASRTPRYAIAQNPLVPAFGSIACPFLDPDGVHPTFVDRGLHHSLLSAPSAQVQAEDLRVRPTSTIQYLSTGGGMVRPAGYPA